MIISENKKYLDRNVSCPSLPNDAESWPVSLNTSVVLIVNSEPVSQELLDKIISWVVSSSTLAVHFCGHSAKVLWDKLLDTLAPEPTKTLMTYFSESSSEIDWVEEFFYASLPAGENWDDWRDRQIFLFGDDHDGLLKVLEGFLDR